MPRRERFQRWFVTGSGPRPRKRLRQSAASSTGHPCASPSEFRRVILIGIKYPPEFTPALAFASRRADEALPQTLSGTRPGGCGPDALRTSDGWASRRAGSAATGPISARRVGNGRAGGARYWAAARRFYGWAPPSGYAPPKAGFAAEIRRRREVLGFYKGEAMKARIALS
jgi:hypothetical protein